MNHKKTDRAKRSRSSCLPGERHVMQQGLKSK
jgi:hypothetical protein